MAILCFFSPLFNSFENKKHPTMLDVRSCGRHTQSIWGDRMRSYIFYGALLGPAAVIHRASGVTGCDHIYLLWCVVTGMSLLLFAVSLFI